MQRSLCKIGRRTYHITYALRYQTEEGGAGGPQAQPKQQRQGKPPEQGPPTSFNPRTSQSQSSKQAGGGSGGSGNWLQSLMLSPHKRNKIDAGEEDHPAKKRAMLPSWLRFSKPSR